MDRGGFHSSQSRNLFITGDNNRGVSLLIEKGAASALAGKGLSTVEVITLLTSALRQIELPPAEGEGLVIVIAGIAMTFEFTPNGLIVSKFTD
jgi:hypothetical protein